MRRCNRTSWFLSAALWLTASAIGQQQFPSQEPPAAAKPRPPAQDAGFSAPTPDTRSGVTSRAPEQPAGFSPPEVVTPEDRGPRSQPAATSSGTQPLLGTARSRFSEARYATDLRLPGAAPFRMHAVFSGEGELARGGTYIEIWLSPVRWRREATSGELRIVETRDGDYLYRKVSGAAFSPRVLDDLLDALDLALPGDEGFVESDWQQGSVVYEGASVFRIASGSRHLLQAYYFGADGNLQAADKNTATIVYSDYEAFHGKQVARHQDLKIHGVKVAGIWIDELAAATTTTGTQFTIDGVRPVSLSDSADYSGPYFTAPHPIYQALPKDPPPGIGTIIIVVSIDPHGHVRDARVQRGINPALDDLAARTAIQWEFFPALRKGRPSASEATVEFSF